MDIPTELIAQFCSVTNAEEPLASQLLRDSGLNLEEAIHSFFAIQEAGGIPSQHDDNDNNNSNDNLSTAAQPAISDPEIINVDEIEQPPAPIQVDTLIPSTNQIPSRSTHFQDPFTANADSPRAEALASLFRPPTHLLYNGSFNEAIQAGQRQSRWILVNMQRTDDFSSLALNRDVWSDPTVQEIIRVHFLFWQRDERVEDAERYRRFYRYSSTPHVAIIDPRTSERVRVWGGDGEAIPLQKLREELADFVTANSLDNDAAVRSRDGEASTRGPSRKNHNNPTSNSKAQNNGHMEMDEDAQLAAAIAASMEDGDAERSDDVEDEEMNENGEENGYTNYLANAAAASQSDRQASRLLSATDPTLNKNRSLRAEQDNAYEESLALDRAKEESERMERERQERVAAEEREMVKQAAEAREQKRRRVPPIPSDDTSEVVTEIAIRLPNGKRLQRKFLASNNVGNVYDFIETECEELDGSFELMQPYPRKTFSDKTALLNEFPPKAALIVHLKE